MFLAKNVEYYAKYRIHFVLESFLKNKKFSSGNCVEESDHIKVVEISILKQKIYKK
jgi:hypothetical protein